MSLNADVHNNGQSLVFHTALDVTVAGTTLGPAATAGTAGEGDLNKGLRLSGARYLVVEAELTVGGGGGTVDVYVQTTLDGGVTWVDIMNFHFTTLTASKVSAVNVETALAAGITPGDGALASNTILSGLLGSQFRTKTVVAGTLYTGASVLTVRGIVKG